MRQTIPLAVLLALLALPSTAARADEWCGFKDKAGAAVACGFSSLAECRQAFGEAKDAICIPDPTFAKRERRKKLAANRE